MKSKGLSAESIRSPTEFVNSTNAKLNYYCNKVRVKFTRSSLKQRYKISYTHSNIVNICIAYESGASSSYNNDPTVKNYLFGAVTLTKNANIEKCKYSGYGIGF